MEWSGRAPAPPRLKLARGAKDKEHAILMQPKPPLVDPLPCDQIVRFAAARDQQVVRNSTCRTTIERAIPCIDTLESLSAELTVLWVLSVARKHATDFGIFFRSTRDDQHRHASLKKEIE